MPEKRRIQQIAFKDAAAAEAAAKAIARARASSTSPRSRAPRKATSTLGSCTKADLLDPKIADAAFALAEGQGLCARRRAVSRTVLLRVTEIAARQDSDLRRGEGTDARRARHRERQRRDPQAARRGRRRARRRQAAEGDRGGPSSSYVDVAESIAPARARRQAGLEGADAKKITASGVRGQQGVESEAIELDDGGYAWVDVARRHGREPDARSRR